MNLIFLIFIASWSIYAQENSHQKAYSEGFKNGYKQGHQQAMEKSKEEFKNLQKNFDHELDQQLNKMEKIYINELDKQAKDFEKAMLQGLKNLPTKESSNKNSLYQEEKIKELFNKSGQAMIQEALEKMRELSDEEIEKNIIGKISSNSFFDYFISDSHFVKNFVIKMIRDKEALPALISIVDQKEDNIWYLLLNFMIIGFFFIFRRFFKKENQKEDISFFKKIAPAFTQFIVHFILFIIYFGSNIYPTIKVLWHSI